MSPFEYLQSHADYRNRLDMVYWERITIKWNNEEKFLGCRVRMDCSHCCFCIGICSIPDYGREHHSGSTWYAYYLLIVLVFHIIISTCKYVAWYIAHNSFQRPQRLLPTMIWVFGIVLPAYLPRSGVRKKVIKIMATHAAGDCHKPSNNKFMLSKYKLIKYSPSTANHLHV